MYAVIPAAGQGQRMRELQQTSSKVLLSLSNKLNILQSSIESLLHAGGCRGISIAARAEDKITIEKILQQSAPGLDNQIVLGGESRQESVYLALRSIIGKTDYVLIHDAARPCCAPDAIKDLITLVKKTGAAILASRVTSTVKLGNSKGNIVATKARDNLWLAQTPQAFLFETVFQAHQQARLDGFAGTDDSELVERLGVQVSLLEGPATNIKVTTPEDLEFCRLILKDKAAMAYANSGQELPNLVR